MTEREHTETGEEVLAKFGYEADGPEDPIQHTLSYSDWLTHYHQARAYIDLVRVVVLGNNDGPDELSSDTLHLALTAAERHVVLAERENLELQRKLQELEPEPPAVPTS